MSKAIKLSTTLVDDAGKYASAFSRSVPKQIEHWAKIGKIAEENPDLSYEFIKEVLVAKEEINRGEISKFQFKSKNLDADSSN